MGRGQGHMGRDMEGHGEEMLYVATCIPHVSHALQQVAHTLPTVMLLTYTAYMLPTCCSHVAHMLLTCEGEH